MKSLDKIPTSKIARATNLVKTGVKVGGNYLSYYGNKLVKSEEEARERLDESNAHDIYDGLKELKGSALKVAQMLSMEKSILPKAYTDQFALSQYSVPPLSGALIRKTFHKYFKCYPEELFDHFTAESVRAASIGQVHQAEKDGKKLAVKIQYPGVANSIKSDLAIVKPFAVRMFNLKGKEAEKYFLEVEEKLTEETDYQLEVTRSMEISQACRHISNLSFPTYYPELSSDRIITMDWLEGRQISDFCKENQDQELGNTLGQALWDFYVFQMHSLKKVHADPHPGNFIITDDNKLGIIDFGCIKEIPEDFYEPYFELTQPAYLHDQEKFDKNLRKLEILREDDSEEEINFFTGMFHEMLNLFGMPFHHDEFDFGDASYFEQLVALGEKYGQKSELRKYNANRGSKHFLYMNRTFFGLYNLLHDLRAKVKTH